jgi:hypothetical protein
MRPALCSSHAAACAGSKIEPAARALRDATHAHASRHAPQHARTQRTTTPMAAAPARPQLHPRRRRARPRPRATAAHAPASARGSPAPPSGGCGCSRRSAAHAHAHTHIRRVSGAQCVRTQQTHSGRHRDEERRAVLPEVLLLFVYKRHVRHACRRGRGRKRRRRRRRGRRRTHSFTRRRARAPDVLRAAAGGGGGSAR